MKVILYFRFKGICLYFAYNQGLPRWHNGKEFTCQCKRSKRRGFNPWVRKISWSRKWQPTLVFLPGKFHEQRSLAGYSSWGCKQWTWLREWAYVPISELPWRLFPGGSVVKSLPAMREMWANRLGQEHPLENEMRSGILAWEFLWREDPGRLQFMGSQKSQIWLSD